MVAVVVVISCNTAPPDDEVQPTSTEEHAPAVDTLHADSVIIKET